MRLQSLESVQHQLTAFVQQFAPLIGRKERCHWCGYYLSGLLLDGERKSIEPMAQRLPGGNVRAMQQFIGQSGWEYRPIQDALIYYVLQRLKIKTGTLVLDDTSFPKQGKSSVGVMRQYCGALGKIANCQSVVSWLHVSSKGHFPLTAQLYLPQAWIDDTRRMNRAGVPHECQVFKEKWRIALEHLDAFRERVPHDLILVDAGYGENKKLLAALDMRKEAFIAQIPEAVSFWPPRTPLLPAERSRQGVTPHQRCADPELCPFKARDYLEVYSESEHRHEWKRFLLPHQKRKRVEVLALRVWESINHEFGGHRDWVGVERWLIIEKHRDGTIKYYVSNLPHSTPLKTLVYRAHERWNVEQNYQELKEELGLDHYEGRSWNGLHHHITLTFMAYDFLLLLRHGRRKKNVLHDSQSSALAQRHRPLRRLPKVRTRPSGSSTTPMRHGLKVS